MHWLILVNDLKLNDRYMAYIMDTNEEERAKVRMNLLMKFKYLILFNVVFIFTR